MVTRSSSSASSSPLLTSAVPSTLSTMAATSSAMRRRVSRSRPRTCTTMPLPPIALMSMLEVSTVISASSSCVFSLMTRAISSLLMVLSSLVTT